MNQVISILSTLIVCVSLFTKLYASEDGYDTLQYQGTLIEAKKQIMLERDDLAEELLKECLRINPGSAIANYELANIYVEQNKLGEALSHAEHAVELSENNIWYHWLLARLYQYMGNLEKTEDAYEEMIERFPEQIDLYYEYAAILTSAGELEDAIEVYEDAEELTGPTEIVEKEIYSLTKKLGDEDEAIELLGKLIENYPYNTEYKHEMANYYIYEGEDERAVEIFKNIIEVNPGDGKTSMKLAEYYRERDKMSESFRYLKMAFASRDIEMEEKINLLVAMLSFVEEDPEIKETAYELVEILSETYPSEAKVAGIYADLLRKEGKYKQAIGQLKIALKRDKDNYQVWKQLLYLQHTVKSYDSLLIYSRMAVDYFPNQPVLYLYKGMAEVENGMYTKAVYSFQDGLSITLSSNKLLKGEFYAQLGYAYHQNGKHEKSDDAFTKALQINPSNSWVLNNYAYYLAERNESLDKAAEMAMRCLESEPSNPNFLDTYAWVLYKQGNYEKALQYIHRAVEESDNPAILEHYGDILFKNGQKENAKAQWQRAANNSNEPSSVLLEKIESGQLPE